MNIVQRLLGGYAFLLAVAVGVNFVLTPLYDDGSTGFPVWAVFNWFMAVGTIIALIASYLQKRRLDESEAGSDLRRYLEVNVAFYASVLLTLWFFWTWFVLIMNRGSTSLWEYINPLFAIVVGVIGLRLWHGSEGSQR